MLLFSNQIQGFILQQHLYRLLEQCRSSPKPLLPPYFQLTYSRHSQSAVGKRVRTRIFPGTPVSRATPLSNHHSRMTLVRPMHICRRMNPICDAVAAPLTCALPHLSFPGASQVAGVGRTWYPQELQTRPVCSRIHSPPSTARFQILASTSPSHDSW